MRRKRLSRVIRIFISSTFIDMEQERTLLHARIFPVVKNFCESRGWRFETIDLRWGITAEEALDNRTLDICLNEIRHSRQISPRPNFIILAGQRYGWIPLPDKLPKNVFEALINESTKEDIDLLERFYILDTNAIDPIYILTKGAEIKVEAEQCHRILTAFATKHSEFENSYLVSATESEIYEGLFKEPDLKENVLLYVRYLTDIPKNKKNIFCQNEQRQNDLLHRLRDYVQKKDTFSIETTYEQYSLGANDEMFIAEMSALLIRQVSEEIERHQQLDGYSEELLIQREETDIKAKNYPLLCGLDSPVLSSLEHSRVVAINGSPHNDSGAMAAHLALSIPNSISRHAGISQGSDSEDSILSSIFYEISGEMPQNNGGILLYREVARLLSKIEKPLTIIITNIDRLPDDNFLLSLIWLPPAMIAPEIKVVLVSEDNPLNLRHGNDISLLDLPKIDAGIVQTVIYERLHQLGRHLSESQKLATDKLIADNSNDLPQNIDLLLQNLKQVKCNAPVNSSVIYPDFFWQEICSPHNNHPLFAQLALALISTVPGGVTDNEILEILATDPELLSSLNEAYGHKIVSGGTTCAIPMSLWSKLYFQLVPILSTAAGISASTHRIAYPSAYSSLYAFLKTETRQRVLKLAKEYFMSPERSESYRATELLPDILLLLGEGEEASKLIHEDSFCNRKIGFGMFKGLKTDFENCLKVIPSQLLATRLEFLLSEQPTLIQYCCMSPRFFKRQFANYIEGNTLQSNHFHVHRRRLLRHEDGAVIAAGGGRLVIVENMGTLAECTLYDISTMTPIKSVDIPLEECEIKSNGKVVDCFFAEIKEATVSDDGLIVGLTCSMGRAIKWLVDSNDFEIFHIEPDDFGDAYCGSPSIAEQKLAYSVRHSNDGESIRIDSETIFKDENYKHFEHLYLSGNGSILYAVSHLYLEYLKINIATGEIELIELKDPDLTDWTTLLGYDKNSDTLFYRGTDVYFPIGAMDMRKQTAATCSGSFKPSQYTFSTWYSAPLDILIIALDSELALIGRNSGEIYGKLRGVDSSRVRILPLDDNSFLCIGKDIAHYHISLI